jgi:polysaccharide export outer membrane protein
MKLLKILRKQQRVVATALALMMITASCTVNSHVMLKTPKGYVFDDLPTDLTDEYTISEGDKLEFKLYSNGGFVVIDMASGRTGNMAVRTSLISYLIKPNGFVKLPILGETNLIGKTVSEAEDFLEVEYAKYYVEPFIQLNVQNKRVIVFPGGGGNAKVVSLQENSVTILELLAQVGGITSNAKASRVKLIREIDGERKVYLIDLSIIEGLDDGQFIVQANDILYVEPNPQIAKEVLQDISPIVSLISSSLLLYFTLRNLVTP